MKQLKTAREWLEQAKAEGHTWADEALREHEERPLFSKNWKFHSTDYALINAFNWHTTSAGFGFWEKIYLIC